MIGYPY